MQTRLNETCYPFLARLTDAARRELTGLRAVRVGSRQGLLQRGDPVGGAYLVLQGSLRVFYLTEEGREATLYTVEPGGTCVLAASASFSREPYPAWADSGPRGCTFVRVPDDAFRRLIDDEPAFRAFVFGALCARVLELMTTIEEVATSHVEQRVARYLLRSADATGLVRATQAGIAAEVGTAREVVFRTLRALAERALVRTGRSRVEVLDAARLGRLALGGREEPRRVRGAGPRIR